MKPQVVIVDDEPAVVEAVCDVLDDANVAAVGCPHGRRVYACIAKMRPELLILDVQMPGVDGIEVFQTLRSDPATAALPVIFFTANVDKLTQRLPDYQAMGAVLLPKPFRIDKLLDMVHKSLSAI